MIDAAGGGGRDQARRHARSSRPPATPASRSPSSPRRKGYRLILDHARDDVAWSGARCCALLGAELVLTPGPQGMKRRDRQGRGADGRDPGRRHPAAVREPGQPARSTAAPPPRRSGTTPTARSTSFVAGVGTGGTITGVGQVLKPRKPALKIVAVEPEDSPVLSGGQPGPHKIQGIGAGFVPRVLDRSVIDEVITVGNENAFDTGAARGAARGHPGRHLVRRRDRGGARGRRAARNGRARPSSSIIPSFAERYLSTRAVRGPVTALSAVLPAIPARYSRNPAAAVVYSP